MLSIAIKFETRAIITNFSQNDIIEGEAKVSLRSQVDDVRVTLRKALDIVIFYRLFKPVNARHGFKSHPLHAGYA